jgi:DNA-binding LytR/AlgR family response regulator
MINFSKQVGRKIATKGYKRKTINIDDIVYILREGYLCRIFIHTGDIIPEIDTLRAFEVKLGNLGFFRIRDNTIINGKYITEMDTRIDKRVVKLGKLEFNISKRRLKQFIIWIS